KRVDAAARLGLGGARAKILTEWGILLADAGALGDASAESVREVLGRLPGARAGVSAVYAGAFKRSLRARGEIVYVEDATTATETNPFPSESTPAKVDAAASAI